MSRLVVVSNRVARPDESNDAQGGLVVGVRRALANRGGTWFGWSGKVTDSSQPLTHSRDGNTEYVTTELTRNEYQGYYQSFCNEILWPLFHLALGFVEFEKSDYAIYRRTNSRFADELVEHLGAPKMTWVHDYHCIPLGRFLRMRGVDGAIGYFHHVPFPDWDLLRVLPVCEELLEDYLSYDMIGFQTENDKLSFINCLVRAFGAVVSEDGRYAWVKGRSVRIEVLPIGIDVDDLIELADTNRENADSMRLQQALNGRSLIIKACRLDYSKGILNAFKGYERFLDNNPKRIRRTNLLAITPVSRHECRGYAELNLALQRASGRINGRFADIDWVPLKHMMTGYPRSRLMGFFQLADIGLVTPTRDGMNLVSKEFVASQKEEDPGVLILSSLAGAAAELDAAVIINPYHIDAIAAAINQALSMSLEERKERHQALIAKLHVFDIDDWTDSFLSMLTQTASNRAVEMDENDTKHDWSENKDVATG